MGSRQELLHLCRGEQWKKIQTLLVKNPKLIWSTEIPFYETVAYWSVLFNKMDMLQFLLQMIEEHSSSKKRREKLLRATFEREGDGGNTLVHNVVLQQNMEMLQFFITNCPSGSSVLQRKNNEGSTPLHWAAEQSNVKMMDFIVANAPMGTRLLRLKNINGHTPLDLMQEGKEHFIAAVIADVGFERGLTFFKNKNFLGSKSPLLLYHE